MLKSTLQDAKVISQIQHKVSRDIKYLDGTPAWTEPSSPYIHITIISSDGFVVERCAYTGSSLVIEDTSET